MTIEKHKILHKEKGVQNLHMQTFLSGKLSAEII